MLVTVSQPKQGGDRIVLVWDVQQGETLMEQPHDTNAGDPAFSADGRYLATVQGDRALVWELSSLVSQQGELKPHRVLTGQEGEVAINLVIFSPDARCLATVSRGSQGRGVKRRSSGATAGYRVKVWDVTDGSQVGQTVECPDAIHFLRFNEDGRKIVTVSEHQARICEVDSGKVLMSFSEDDRSMHVAFPSVDGRWLATVADDTVRLWDVSNGEPLTPRLDHLFGVRHVSFGQNGDLLATCAYDPPWHRIGMETVKTSHATVRYMHEVDPLTGKIVLRPITETASRTVTRETRHGRVSDGSTCFATGFKPLEFSSHVGELGVGLRTNHASFNADGRLAIARSRRTARVWDVVAGKAVTPPLRHGGTVVGASLSRDGKLALTIGSDHAVRIWGLGRTGGFRRRDGGRQSVSWTPETDLAILRSGCERRSWNLTPENRSPEHIVRLAQVLSGCYVAENGGLEDLKSDELKRGWQVLHNEFTKDFLSSGRYLIDHIAWHEKATRNRRDGMIQPDLVLDSDPSIPPRLSPADIRPSLTSPPVLHDVDPTGPPVLDPVGLGLTRQHGPSPAYDGKKPLSGPRPPVVPPLPPWKGEQPDAVESGRIVGKLEVLIADCDDPIAIDTTTTYIVSIENGRNVTDRNVTITIHLPVGMEFVKLSGPVGGRSKSEDGRTIEVTPVARIRAGETLSPFRIEVRGIRIGKHTVRVKVNSLRSAEPVITEEDTVVDRGA